jgi:NAD(P)-dependent dehydrogenase (short-subunit alcohol dehydrogenase family)
MQAIAQPGSVAIFIGSLAGHSPPPSAPIIAILDDPLSARAIERIEQQIDAAARTSLQAYHRSKFALKRMCERKAAAWGKRGARILKYELLAKTPLEREATMLEIADAIEFLSSGRASFITGTDLLVDGGVSATLRHAAG